LHFPAQDGLDRMHDQKQVAKTRFLLWQASKRLNDGVAFHALTIRDHAENGIQRSDAKVFVGGNGEALV